MLNVGRSAQSGKDAALEDSMKIMIELNEDCVVLWETTDRSRPDRIEGRGESVIAQLENLILKTKNLARRHRRGPTPNVVLTARALLSAKNKPNAA